MTSITQIVNTVIVKSAMKKRLNVYFHLTSKTFLELFL